jgi:hypothetical protein
MSEPEGTRIVCANYSLRQMLALPGNVQENCLLCGRAIVLSVEGQRLAADPPEPPVELVCIQCAGREMPDLTPEVVPGAVDRAARAQRMHSVHIRAAMEGKTLREIADEQGDD